MSGIGGISSFGANALVPFRSGGGGGSGGNCCDEVQEAGRASEIAAGSQIQFSAQALQIDFQATSQSGTLSSSGDASQQQGQQQGDGGQSLVDKFAGFDRDLAELLSQLLEAFGQQGQGQQNDFASLVQSVFDQATGGASGISGAGGGSGSGGGYGGFGGGSGLGSIGGDSSLSLSQTSFQFKATFENLQSQLDDGQSLSSNQMKLEFQLQFSELNILQSGSQQNDSSQLSSAFNQLSSGGGSLLNSYA